MGKKEIEFKTWLTRDEMVNYLHQLADCLGQGRVVLQRGSDYMELTPAQSLDLEMEGVQKKGQQKISLKICWRQVVLEPVDEPLLISSESRVPLEIEEQGVGQTKADLATAADQELDTTTLEDLSALAATEAGSEEKPKRGKAPRN